MKTLEQKIEDLKNEHYFDVYAKSISFGIKHVACVSERNFISFDCKSIEEAKILLTNLKPTNTVNYVGTAKDTFYKIIDSPYRLDINNPAIPNQYNDFNLKISFEFNDIDIWIKIPLRLIGFNLFNKEKRKVTDSELHYFGGMDRKKIFDLTCYNFNNRYVVSFYGGQKTLFCGIETDYIINHILIL